MRYVILKGLWPVGVGVVGGDWAFEVKIHDGTFKQQVSIPRMLTDELMILFASAWVHCDNTPTPIPHPTIFSPDYNIIIIIIITIIFRPMHMVLLESEYGALIDNPVARFFHCGVTW